ncbi:MAG: AMP-binding protein [Candidatus Omnitrophica bacterium]|nr:AMP-binding protein [Candidatus Omnitrophota bacterium]
MPDWLKLYHRLPYPLRVLATSARGYYLRWWRYGPETERLVEEALERESWSPKQWKVWQEERLAYILHRARHKVPYYREYWDKRRRVGDKTSWEYLENWPILKKEEVRKNPKAFVAEDCDIRKMYCDHTSGTTGTPLRIYLKRETVRHWYALFEARIRRWHGVSVNESWAILGGQLAIPFHQQKPPFWVYNAGLNQLYLSTYHLSPQNARWYAEALRRYTPTHLIAYPSSLSVLAAAILDQGLTPPVIRVIFSNAEPLLPSHKEVISKTFQCPIRNTYGMGEIVAAASECEHGMMHFWPEVGYIEVLNGENDTPAPVGKAGRLVATGLLNADMPLIRYEVGDRIRLNSSQICTCVRLLPHLAAIEGRLNDLIVTPDGRRIFWLNPVFYGLPIREVQIIQETLERLRVCIVPAPGYTKEDAKTIIQRLHQRVGDIKIVLEIVDFIPRDANGKFKAVVSYVK